MGKLADDLEVGVDGDAGALPVLAQLGGDRGGGVAGAPRFLALAVDDRAVRVAVQLDEEELRRRADYTLVNINLGELEYEVARLDKLLRDENRKHSA